MGLSIGDQLRNGLGRNRWMHLQHKRRAGETRNWGNVTIQVEAKFVVERRVDCVRPYDREQRITVWRCTHDRFSSRLALAPGRFSMMNCWPSRSDSPCAMRRAIMSVVPPAEKPTMIRTGRAG